MRSVLFPVLAVFAAACDTMTASEPGALVPRTVTEDPTLPALTLNGRQFHAEAFGNAAGPVIVFLHGGPGGDYRSLFRLADSANGRSLADDHYLVFWDQRGAGLSERVGKAELTMDQYDADLLALVDRYSPTRPVLLIGQSWGGMLATSFINRHPARVAGAVLIEPGPLTGATFERIKSRLFDLNPTREWLNDVVWSSQFFSADDDVTMDYERTLGAKVGQPRFHERRRRDPEPFWRIGARANRYLQEDGQDDDGTYTYDFTSHLAAFTPPVLFIAGARSEVLGPSLQQKQVAHYPRASLTVIAGAGHDVHWTQTPAVLTAIQAYLATIEGGTP